MRIPRRFVVAAGVALVAVVLLLLTVATALLSAETSGSERLAWGSLAVAFGLCTLTSIAGLVLLRRVRRWWIRKQREGRRASRQVSVVAADLQAIRSRVDSLAGRRALRGVDEKSSAALERLADVQATLEGVPDTARLHKLLELTGRRTSASIGQLDSRVATLADALADATRSAASNDDVAALGKQVRALRKDVAAVRKHVSSEARLMYGQVDGLAALYAAFRPGTALPPLMFDWAIGADLAAYLVRRVLSDRRTSVVELGSGVSTVLLALALREVGVGLVVSLEHDPFYAAKTRRMLEEFEVTDWAVVIEAPLVPTEVDGTNYQWYDVSGVALPERIDVLLVDGPPGATGPQARYPAVPVLRDRLSDRAIVVLDDAARDDEAETIARWCAGYELVAAPGKRFMSGAAELLPTVGGETTPRTAIVPPSQRSDGVSDAEVEPGSHG